MELKIEIDDEYMGDLMADVHAPADECACEALGILRWAIDIKKSGRVLCLCDPNGHNLQVANIPIINRGKKL